MASLPGGQKIPVSPAELAQLEHAFAIDPTSDAFRPLAEAYLNLGRFMEAMVVCKKGVKSHPQAATARVLLARVYAEQGKDKKALEELQGALQVAPSDLVVLRLAGHLALTAGEEIGRQYLKKALALAPNDPETLAVCGKWGVELPKPEPPPAPAPAATARAPGPAGSSAPPVLQPMAASGRAQPQTSPQAARTARPAQRPARQDGSRPQARRPSFEELASRYGDPDEERSLSRRSGGRGLGITIVTAALGLAALGGYFAFTKWKQDRDRKISKLLKDASDQVARDTYDGYKRAAEDLEGDKKVLDLDPTNIGAHAYLAYIYAIRWGELGEGEAAAKTAKEHLEAAKRIRQEHSHLLAADSLIRFYSGETQQAEDDLEKLVKELEDKGQHSGLLYITLAKEQTQNGELEKALATLKKAQQAEPTSPRVFAALGNVYRRIGGEEEFNAATNYESALRYEANHAEARMGVVLMTLQDLKNPKKRETAEDYIKRVLNMDPPAAPRQIALAHLAKSVLLFDSGNREEGRKEEERAFQADPQNGELFMLKAERLFRENQTGAAVAEAKRAIALDPKRASFYLSLAAGLMAQANGCKGAITEMQAARRALPGNVPIMIALGDAYDRCNDLDSALAEYTRATGDDNTKSPEARWRQAGIFRKKKNFRRAFEIYERAAQDALGKARIQSDIQVDEGLAYEEAPPTADSLNKEEDLFRRAINANDQNAEAYFYRGRLLIPDKNPKVKATGKEMLDKYIEMAPNGSHAEEAKRLGASPPAAHKKTP